MNIKFLTVSCFGLVAAAQALTINDAAGWLESAYVEWSDDGSSSYSVYYSGNGESDVKLDDQLVRNYGSYWRADAVGLKAGTYTLKVVPSSGSSATTSSLTVKAHDRTGFAFSDGHIPGAYNLDGTLKSGAVVLYISNSSKDNVSLDVTTSSKGATTACTGLQNILTAFKKGYDSRPLDVRILGNVTDPSTTDKGDILVDLGSSESASLTIEGVGKDATANGWGIRVKNAYNVEIRNLGIMNVDSDEGDNIGLQQSDFYVWVHNNDFFYGDAGSDADQVKGDGALDCKKSNYITFSYNHFWDNGKSNLLGLSEGTFSYSDNAYYITYHHNWYDHSDSRHPRVRFYNAHIYNNYYDGNAKYGAGSTKGSSLFMEGNYFRSCKYPMLTSMQGNDLYAGSTSTKDDDNGTFSSEDGGVIKAFNNYMTGTYSFIAYGASEIVVKGVKSSVGSISTTTDFDAYVVSSRTETVPSSIHPAQGSSHYYSNFDTGSKMYSYKADEPEAAKANVIAYAGRCQGGDFKWNFSDSEDEIYAVNEDLKAALVAYKGGGATFTGGVVVTSSSSETPAESSSSEIASSSSEPEIPAESSSSSEKSVSSSSETPAESSSSENVSSSSEADSPETPVESSSSEGGKQGMTAVETGVDPLHYSVGSARLTVHASDIIRLDVIRMDGRKVRLAACERTVVGTEYDMNSLQSGIYFVRLVTSRGIFQQKIFKK